MSIESNIESIANSLEIIARVMSESARTQAVAEVSNTGFTPPVEQPIQQPPVQQPPVEQPPVQQPVQQPPQTSFAADIPTDQKGLDAAVVAEAKRLGAREPIIAVFAEFGIQNLTQLPVEQYGPLLQRIRAIQ